MYYPRTGQPYCLRMVSSEDDREENIGASEEFERDFNEGSEKEQKNVTI